MSAVERLEHPPGDGSSLGLVDTPSETSTIEAKLTQSPAGRSARLRPLLALVPYVARSADVRRLP